MPILFDTCSFIWRTAGSPKLSVTALRAISANADQVLLSVASLIEIAGLQTGGRTSLTVAEARRLAAEFDIRELPITGEFTVALARLPLRHRDPLDRMLVAQAQLSGAAILTPDAKIAAYDVQVIW